MAPPPVGGDDPRCALCRLREAEGRPFNAPRLAAEGACSFARQRGARAAPAE